MNGRFRAHAGGRYTARSRNHRGSFMSVRAALIALCLAVILLPGLSACGQKGGLYLPDDAPPQEGQN